MEFKSGFVSIVGNPNVGKSTLFNKLIEEDLSIVTHKPQTSRNKLLGLINSNKYQIILIDTPGFVKPSYKLHDYMNSNIFSSLEGSDLVIYLTDINEKKINQNLLSTIIKKNIPLYCIVNKSDLITNDGGDYSKIFYSHKFEKFDLISSKSNEDIEKVKNNIIELLPMHEPYYSKNCYTTSTERQITEEIIRKYIFLNYKEEIPYSSYVNVCSFKESKNIIDIYVYIYIENNNQKKIIIGKRGMGLKKLGTNSRYELEKFFSKKIYLDLTVKIKKWRSNDIFLNYYLKK